MPLSASLFVQGTSSVSSPAEHLPPNNQFHGISTANTRPPPVNRSVSRNNMPDNLDFIVFAVKQAKEAEDYGFTRNESCRNLKTALHQYWQNKTMGLHGQSQKKNIPRSKAAASKEFKDCDVEHVVPKMEIVNMLMDMNPLSKLEVGEILDKYFRVLLVTKEEHRKLNASGLRSKMPKNWDKKDVLARYRAVGIEPENG